MTNFIPAILYYDYTLTLGDEIDYFWNTAKMSLVSTLFVLNRYLHLQRRRGTLAQVRCDGACHPRSIPGEPFAGVAVLPLPPR